MRTMLCFATVIGVTVFASAQTASAPKSNWLADSVNRNGGLVRMGGNVRIAACAVVSADEAVAHVGADGFADPNGDVELRGNVHMRLTNGVDPLQ